MTGEVQWAFCYDHTILQGLSLNWTGTVSSAGLEWMWLCYDRKPKCNSNEKAFTKSQAKDTCTLIIHTLLKMDTEAFPVNAPVTLFFGSLSCQYPKHCMCFCQTPSWVAAVAAVSSHIAEGIGLVWNGFLCRPWMRLGWQRPARTKPGKAQC